MRRLTKGPRPTLLITKAREWTDEYKSALSKGKPPPARWRHKQIRAALTAETSERCAYCDSHMLAIHKGHIEHILPRSKRPELVVEWENLTLACETCNLAKSDYYSTSVALLNPYHDDPSEHLLFVGDLIMPYPGSDRGLVTVQRLKLLRKNLVDDRKNRLQHVHCLVDSLARASDNQVRSTIMDILREDIERGPHQATVQAFINSLGIVL